MVAHVVREWNVPNDAIFSCRSRCPSHELTPLFRVLGNAVTDRGLDAERRVVATEPSHAITRRDFGVDASGRMVERFTLRNAPGAELSFLSLGGIVQSLRMPDRYGQLGDVVLGFDSLDAYLIDTRYVGAIIGRYANRIAHGRLTLDGRDVTLEANEAPHHLHGGVHGFNAKHWQVATFNGLEVVGASLTYDSSDGDSGFPGALAVRVTYMLSDDNTSAISYDATTTAPTPVNLTHHCYFNLSLRVESTILDHTLQLYASRYLPVDATMIPTGDLHPVAGTPFDFTTPHRIGARIRDKDEQLERWIARGTRGTCTAMSRGYRAGDAALPGLAESCRFSVDDTATRQRVPLAHRVPLYRQA